MLSSLLIDSHWGSARVRLSHHALLRARQRSAFDETAMFSSMENMWFDHLAPPWLSNPQASDAWLWSDTIAIPLKSIGKMEFLALSWLPR